jgi:hypothetical protein
MKDLQNLPLNQHPSLYIPSKNIENISENTNFKKKSKSYEHTEARTQDLFGVNEM